METWNIKGYTLEYIDEINKISCSEFWKGKNSYANLQDNYHKYLTKCGFNLERSRNVENTHLAIKDLKVITNFEEQQFLNKLLDQGRL